MKILNKKNLRRIILSGLFMLLVLLAQAQNYSGEVTYVAKAKVAMKLDTSKYDQSMRNKIAGFFTKQFKKTYEMTFNKYSSSYREKSKLTIQGRSSANNDILYKNVQKKEYKHQVELLGKLFLIEDTLEEFQWKTHSNTKKIGKFTCYKATSKDKEGQETIAWYTLDIPIANGPEKYWGLPGLILEVINDKVHIASQEIDVSDKKVKIPKRGKSVTQEKFEKIKKEKDSEKDDRLNMMKSLEKGGN